MGEVRNEDRTLTEYTNWKILYYIKMHFREEENQGEVRFMWRAILTVNTIEAFSFYKICEGS
jgi:hypothetical protein